jgi:phi LC3 family holin
MKINLKVRFKNKLFWLAIIPALLLLIKAVANVFGINLEFVELENNLIAVVEAVFLVLGIVGIVTDHTTEGLSDSENALTYDKPKK